MRSTWVIPTNTWHARLYWYWRKHLGNYKASGYRENLCHYWRVCIFWAPLSAVLLWFLLGMKPSNAEGDKYKDSLPPVFPVALLFLVGIWGALWYIDSSFGIVYATLGFVGIPVFIVFGIWGAVNMYTALKERNKPKKERFNLPLEYVRAKKHRICPYIEFEEANK